MLVIFDVVGTLFSLERVRQSIKAQDLPSELLPWWFGRLLQSAMAATLADRYLPFRQAAEVSLKQVLAIADRPENMAESILAEMQELTPWPDAFDCLQTLHQSHHLVALTNSSVDAAEGLIGKAGLRDLFRGVLSTDEVRACKPDPRPYRMALARAGRKPSEAWMVAAHGWDVLGADAVGMRTVWIDRVEKRWPFPGNPPDCVAADLAQVAETIDRIGK
jgi:2-haloacid dehalogenase